MNEKVRPWLQIVTIPSKQCRLGNIVLHKSFSFFWIPAFASDRPGNAGAHKYCLLSGERNIYLDKLYIFFFFKCIIRAEQYSIFCSYLHSCEPPIIHGNLTCDTIFIQHNGLIKIGSGRRDGLENKIGVKITCGAQCTCPPRVPVAPDTINNHVKTCREEKKSLHFFAPEYGGKIISDCDIFKIFVHFLGSVWSDSNQLNVLSAVANVTTAVDIYSFGMCALEVSGNSRWRSKWAKMPKTTRRVGEQKRGRCCFE